MSIIKNVFHSFQLRTERSGQAMSRSSFLQFQISRRSRWRSFGQSSCSLWSRV